MKKIVYIILTAICFYACDMEEPPKAQVDKKPVFNTESGLKMYTNSFYELFEPVAPSMYSANSYYIATNQVIRYLTENAFSAEESTGWNWGELRNINYFIANCTDESVPVETRNNYIGMARFFRAYFYFNRMKQFGDLPWIDHPLDVKDPLLYAGRDKRALIVDKIKEDIDFAIAHIKTKKDPSCSTITSAVAAALKSRVCLWEGTYRKYHKLGDAEEWLKEAVSASEYVMKAGYSIYNGDGAEKSYRKLFVSKVPVTEEVIYAITFDGTLGVVHSGNRRWTSVTFGNCPSLTRSFVNTYLTLDGTPFTDKSNYKTMSFTEECKNRDTRLAQTIRTPGFTRLDGSKVVETSPNYAYAITGYHTCKFTLDDMQYDNVDICDNNTIFFRYAEVLLNYAEAKAELNTLTDEDWSKTIGTIRARAGITGGLSSKPVKVDTYLQSRFFPSVSNPVLLEIRRERAIELSFEGFGWSDICRWKIGEATTNVWDGIYIPELEVAYDMNGDGVLDVCFTKKTEPEKAPGVFYLYVGEKLANGTTNNYQIDKDGHTLVFMKDQKRTWHDKLYFHPIPAVDYVKNPNLGQNPGW